MSVSGAPRRTFDDVVVSHESEEVRPVLGPAGNNKTPTKSSLLTRKPLPKNKTSSLVTSNNNQTPIPTPELEDEGKYKNPSSYRPPITTGVVLRRRPPLQNHLLSQRSNLSLNASCSSDVSSDSFQSRASTGKIFRPSNNTTITKFMASTRRRRNHYQQSEISISDTDSQSSIDTFNSIGGTKKRCAWVTPNTEPCYAAFHDEEWGVPVHDDKKLFELLVFSGALAELTWPSILMKRHTFREVFADFDPVSISKMNDKKMSAAGPGLLSELKLRAIIENARQITNIINEYGSFDKYIWSFVNYKPIVNSFRYPRQVPAKTSKADAISKDLLRRGFRSVSATVIYSFMQVAGITNDHLTSCFRYHECCNTNAPSTVAPAQEKEREKDKDKDEEVSQSKDMLDLGLARAMDDLSFPSE